MWWPFKRKPKAKERVVEPTPPEVVKALESEPEPLHPTPTWADQISAAIPDRGRHLRDLLDMLVDLGEKITEDLGPVVALLDPLYGKANNNSACPCRTTGGKIEAEVNPFKYCCKPNWKAIKQMYADQRKVARREAEAQVKEAAQARKEERVKESMTWLVRVGMDEQGRISMDPLPDSHKFTMRQVCDALEVCAWQAREMIMGEVVKNQVLSVLYRASQQRQAGP